MFDYEAYGKIRLQISKCEIIVKQIGSNNEIILKFKQPNRNYKIIDIDPDEVTSRWIPIIGYVYKCGVVKVINKLKRFFLYPTRHPNYQFNQ